MPVDPFAAKTATFFQRITALFSGGRSNGSGNPVFQTRYGCRGEHAFRRPYLRSPAFTGLARAIDGSRPHASSLPDRRVEDFNARIVHKSNSRRVRPAPV